MLCLHGLPSLQQGQQHLFQLVLRALGKTAQRQLPSAAQMAQARVDQRGHVNILCSRALSHAARQIGQHIGDQCAHHAVFLQTREAKRLVVGSILFGRIEHHAQALAKEGFNGMAQETGQLHHAEWHAHIRCPVHGRGTARLQDRYRLRMGRTPFTGMGPQAGLAFKIAPTEGLQRVLGGALRQHIAAPTGGQVVAQLRHQHRRWLLAVVAHAATGPADIQHTPCRQQGFQHQLAVIALARAVTGSVLSWEAHQVKIAAWRTARVIAVVHAQQTDHLEGNRTHGHEGAESHATRAKALVQRRLFERIQPRLACHRQRHVLVKTSLIAGILPACQGVIERGEHLTVGVVGRLQQVGQQGAAALRPLQRRCRHLRLGAPLFQPVQQAGQHTGQFGL